MPATLIIAEAGVNHNGSLDLAKELINVAAEAGADIVKFQSFKTENLVSAVAEKAAYQKANATSVESQFEMLKRLELSREDHEELMRYCVQKKIKFWSTAFDNDSIVMLRELGITMWKIPSGEITNLPFLEKIGSFGQEVILSTGMCTLAEISDAINCLTSAGTSKENITILHCNTEYPTPMKDVNLRAMLTIRDTYQVRVGYSDHTSGIEVSVAAVALGAQVIEKHFTLDRTMEGPDHKASLEPSELRELVSSIRNIEQALGDGEKRVSASEYKNIAIARKSIHLKNQKKKGEILTAADLVMKRPGDGISPMKLRELVGRSVKTDLSPDHKLAMGDLI